MQCRNWEVAQAMLNLAVASGFRESGILMGRRIILGIRTTANSMEFPIAENGELLVSKEYIESNKYLIYSRLVNFLKIDEIQDSISKRTSDRDIVNLRLRMWFKEFEDVISL